MMETTRERRKKTAEQARAAQATPLTTEGTREARHPMGSLRSWMMDFGVLGAVTGLTAAIVHLLPGGLSTGWPALVGAPLLLGLAAALAGAVAGAVLRVLRGRVPAALGVLLAGTVVNFVGSLITTSLPWERVTSTALIEGKAAPLSLAVFVMIPVVAVVRWRGQSTLPWLLLAGALAGMLIGVY